MARFPSVSLKGGEFVRASVAELLTNPSSVAPPDVGVPRLKSTWASFHDGEGFSMHMVCRWKTGTWGLLVLPTHTLGGGNAGSHPGLEAVNGKPSNCWAGKPLADQKALSRPK